MAIHPIVAAISQSGEKWWTNQIKAFFCKLSLCVTVLHLVISPPPPSRSATSRPSSACVLTPPLVVIVTSLLPTSQVILRPPAKRNSAMGDLRGQKQARSWLLCMYSFSCTYPGSGMTATAYSWHKTIIVPTATQTYWLIKNKKNQVVNLLGRAEKLEKTYRAIMSRHVSVSSRWTVFSPSSAWVTAFSSAEPRLQVVVEVCILHEATGRGLKHGKEGRGGGGGRHTGSRYILMCNQCTQRHASSDIQTERNAARHNNSHSPMSMFLTIPHAMQAFISTHASICVYIRKYTNRITFSRTNTDTDTRWDVV